MFRGLSPLALDGKGRLSIPAKFRERLGEICNGHLVVTIHSDRCLLIFPLPEWEIVEKKLTQLPSTHKRALALRRLLIGHAEDCEMDGQGRILLSASLRQFAALDKRVVLVGQGSRFELWDEQTWHQKREQWLAEQTEETEGLPGELESLSF
ncbi:MAG: division/cell wall cluster transcriptional repressor MraZ [Candidatus Competibacteraceae bacterium]|nr:division/cell wall cluster transcriptional repressor MraZ [Candidatus Competibacteraceae bacterium]